MRYYLVIPLVIVLIFLGVLGASLWHWQPPIDQGAEDFLSQEQTAVSEIPVEQPKSINEVPVKQPPNESLVEAVRVPILVYHSILPYYPSESSYRKRFDVEPAMFERQLRYLHENGYTVISFDDLLNYFSSGPPLPQKPVVLTFDDGWANQYTHALPILKKYNDTATFFIFTNKIGSRLFLTWPQIKELDASQMTIGGHTESHPLLYRITNEDVLRREIAGSKKILEDNLGKPIDIFAYPYGRFTEKIITILKESGFRAARVDGYKGITQTPDELYTLKGTDVSNDFAKFIGVLNSAQ